MISRWLSVNRRETDIGQFRMSLLNEIAAGSSVKISRRRFMKVGAVVAMSSLSPCPCFAAIRAHLLPERRLAFHNAHTGESLETVYWADGKYLSPAIAEINYVLRDHRTNEIKSIDASLLDLLSTVAMKLDTRQPFHVVSGYRSPKTNALLRQCGRNVAKNSLHMQGQAADIRLPDIRLSLLRQTVADLKGGGVGYYPRSKFVHIDVGPVRYW
jgi:uncharacterized protein YcbK (DUF882 family)